MDNQEQNGLGINPQNQEPINAFNSVPTDNTQPVSDQTQVLQAVNTEPVQNNDVVNNVTTSPVKPVQTPEVPFVTETPQVDVNPVPSEASPVEAQPVENVEPVVTNAPEVTSPVEDSVEPQNNNNNKGNKVFICIVVILILVIAVLGIIILNRKGKTETGSVTTTTTLETFTKVNMTTNDVNSTTKLTFNNTNNYTTSTRANRNSNDPQSVKQNGSVLKVDNYEYDLTGGDMVVYSLDGQDFIYDTKDDAEIIVDIYNGKGVKDVIPLLQEVADSRYKQGYNVVEGNSGTLSGVSVAYLLLSDDQYLYYEFYLDTGYGDLARYIFLAKKKFTVDSVAKLLYELNSVAVKKNSGTASAGIADSLPTRFFDERLLSD